MAGASRDPGQARRRAQRAVRRPGRGGGPRLLDGVGTGGGPQRSPPAGHQQRQISAVGDLPLGRRPAAPRDHRRSDRAHVGDHQRGGRVRRRQCPALGASASTCSASDSPPGNPKSGSAASNAAWSSGAPSRRSRHRRPSQLPRSDSIRSSSTTGSAPTASPTVAAVCRARCSGEVQIATTPAARAPRPQPRGLLPALRRQGRVTAAENLPTGVVRGLPVPREQQLDAVRVH